MYADFVKTKVLYDKDGVRAGSGSQTGLKECPACGYCLRGLPAACRCPECGFEYDATTRVWTDRREGVGLLLCTAAVVMLLGAVLVEVFPTPGTTIRDWNRAVVASLGVVVWLFVAVRYLVRLRRRAYVLTWADGIRLNLQGKGERRIGWNELRDVELIRVGRRTFTRLILDAPESRIDLSAVLRKSEAVIQFAATAEEGKQRSASR